MAQKIDGKTVTKRDLVFRIASNSKLKQALVRDIIQAFIDEIIAELAEGNRIELRDFGVFEVRLRHQRKARNPKTGQQVDVPPKRVVTIKAGKKMKDLINKIAARNAAAAAAAAAQANQQGGQG